MLRKAFFDSFFPIILGLDQTLVCSSSSLSGFEPPDISRKTFSHPNDDTPLFTPVTRLESSASNLMRYFTPLQQCGQPSASQSFIFITIIAPVAVPLSSPFPSCAEWPSSTKRLRYSSNFSHNLAIKLYMLAAKGHLSIVWSLAKHTRQNPVFGYDNNENPTILP